MTERGTTRVTVYRTPPPPPTNQRGGPLDVDTVHLSGVIGSLLMREARQWQPGEHRLTNVEQWVFRPINYTVDIAESDRIEDERTGDRFVVESVTLKPSSVGRKRLRVELKKIN